MSAQVDTPNIKPTTLYVGDLHPLVSDALLFTKFTEVGPVVNARVCRDMLTRDSLGYGYVNYRDPRDAEQALEILNYQEFYGRRFRLMWSQKDPSLRKSGKGNVFIKNLDKSITPNELYDTFEQFGKILSCKLATDESGQSKGFGFVHFELEECAGKAIDYVNGKEIRNRTVYVGPFISKTERKSPGGAAKFNNCYVKNFGDDMDDERFRKLFEKFGEIKSACVMKSDQGVSKGFGFVCFEEPSSAEAAVREMDGHDLGGKPLYVGRAQRKEERQEELKAKYEKQKSERQSRYIHGVNLYVKNLEDNIDDEKLREAFARFGDITSAKVMRDQNGASRNFGFVCFRTPEHATLAVSNVSKVTLGSKPLYVAIAQRKEDRKAKLAADYHARMEQMRNSVYSMHPSLSFMPTAAPTAGYGPNRNFYQRQYPNSTPRWQQQAMMPNVPQAAAYQQNLAAQTVGGQNMAQMMSMRNNQAGGMGGRVGPAGGPGMNAAAGQMALGQQFARQNQARQISTGMNPAAGMANRAGMGMQMSQQNVMQNRAAAGQMAQVQQAGANVAAGMQNRGAGQARSAGMAVQPAQKEASQAEDADKHRVMLGNRLYSLVEHKHPEHVGKITGMILSMPITEITALFDNPEELDRAISKAHEMIKTGKQDKGKEAAAKAN